jgi:hypothetical protein
MMIMALLDLRSRLWVITPPTRLPCSDSQPRYKAPGPTRLGTRLSAHRTPSQNPSGSTRHQGIGGSQQSRGLFADISAGAIPQFRVGGVPRGFGGGPGGGPGDGPSDDPHGFGGGFGGGPGRYPAGRSDGRFLVMVL